MITSHQPSTRAPVLDLEQGATAFVINIYNTVPTLIYSRRISSPPNLHRPLLSHTLCLRHIIPLLDSRPATASVSSSLSCPACHVTALLTLYVYRKSKTLQHSSQQFGLKRSPKKALISSCTYVLKTERDICSSILQLDHTVAIGKWDWNQTLYAKCYCVPRVSSISFALKHRIGSSGASGAELRSTCKPSSRKGLHRIPLLPIRIWGAVVLFPNQSDTRSRPTRRRSCSRWPSTPTNPCTSVGSSCLIVATCPFVSADFCVSDSFQLMHA
ncbi:hypothetical protein PENSPDRAFT_336724 [Peniophora sp. CONT]|nr:hypothetical protein PENSPDRAFT_336724 [Peniophora sp. CONT]